MPVFEPLLWRAAAQIEIAYRKRKTGGQLPRWPQSQIDAVSQTRERLDRIQPRGWEHAFRIVSNRLKSQLELAKDQIRAALEGLERLTERTSGPTQEAIYAELVALNQEFDEFVIDMEQHTVMVVTEPITLHDVELGKFSIVWNWSQCGPDFHDRTYQVIALPSKRRLSTSRFEHPHVMDYHLCEGDAAEPMQLALRAGRLTDFFLMILSVLRTYNSSSAYVKLSTWTGSPCRCCGEPLDDEADTCRHCNQTTCESCSNWCENCQSVCCDSCTSSCAQCDEQCCPTCLKWHSETREHRCPKCFQLKETTQENTDETTLASFPSNDATL